jgi:hypothetical protein
MGSSMLCNLNEGHRGRGGNGRGAGSMNGSTRTLFPMLSSPGSLLNHSLLSIQMLTRHLGIAAVLRVEMTVTPATDGRRWSGEWREG